MMLINESCNIHQNITLIHLNLKIGKKKHYQFGRTSSENLVILRGKKKGVHVHSFIEVKCIYLSDSNNTYYFFMEKKRHFYIFITKTTHWWTQNIIWVTQITYAQYITEYHISNEWYIWYTLKQIYWVIAWEKMEADTIALPHFQN